MRIYTFPLTCDVCGGDGVGTIQTAGAAWDSRSTVVHSDPTVCRGVLDRRRRDLEAREAAVEEARS